MPDLPIALARALHLGALFSLFGAFLFEAAVARPAPALGARLDRLSAWSLAAALAAALLWLLLEGSAIADVPLADSLPVLGTVLLRTWFGTALLVHFGGLVLAGAALLLGRRRGRPHRLAPALGAAGAGAAILARAAIGHAAAMAGWQRPAMMLVQSVHVVAAGAWLGSLLPLLLLLGDAAEKPSAFAAVRRFSRLGMAAVTAVALSAAANGWVFIGSIAGLLGTTYGHWVLVKTALVAAMIGLAALNRFIHAPALAGKDAAVAARLLRRGTACEIVLGAGIIIAAGLLATSAPAASP
jgi:putative copper export protein